MLTLTRADLHDYQTRAVDAIKTKRRYMLALEMGLGKTSSTLTAVSDLLDEFLAHKVLVVAPLRVALSVWQDEIRTWDHLRHLSITSVLGTERQRLAALQRVTDIYTINRENLPWLVTHYGKKWPFDVIVIDESSSFKSASSQRFKALKKVAPECQYMVLLTGTPAPNSLLDIWSQMYLIDFGATLGRTMSGYKQRFFEQQGYGGYTMTIRPGAAETIHKLIEPLAMSMAAADYLDLPDRLDITHRVTLPEKSQQAYLAFERDLLIEFASGEDIEAASAAVLAGKLLQWCNGSIYTDEHGNYMELHKAKLDALSEIREDNAGETMLVAYAYKADLERLKARFPDAVVLDKDPETIARWNRGEISMLLAHPASAGHGLNLQHGGSLIVWFGLCWSLEYYQQFNARLHRQGQQCAVRILHLVADGCLDERVLQVLANKDATQQQLLLALKAK
jgi:SNF2 family DNA or RNA helicase